MMSGVGREKVSYANVYSFSFIDNPWCHIRHGSKQ